MSSTPVPQLTVRAVVLSVVLAMVLAAANTYLGLFAGLTIATAIPAAVVSMVSVLMPALSAANENAMVKQAACAAPTISSGLVPLRSSPKRLAMP